MTKSLLAMVVWIWRRVRNVVVVHGIVIVEKVARVEAFGKASLFSSEFVELSFENELLLANCADFSLN